MLEKGVPRGLREDPGAETKFWAAIRGEAQEAGAECPGGLSLEVGGATSLERTWMTAGLHATKPRLHCSLTWPFLASESIFVK